MLCAKDLDEDFWLSSSIHSSIQLLLALAALAAAPLMWTDLAASAFLAHLVLSTVQTDLAASAFLAHVAPPPMWTDLAASAILARLVL